MNRHSGLDLEAPEKGSRDFQEPERVDVVSCESRPDPEWELVAAGQVLERHRWDKWNEHVLPVEGVHQHTQRLAQVGYEGGAPSGGNEENFLL